MSDGGLGAEPKRLPVMRGQVLVQDNGDWVQLFAVAEVRELKKGGISAKLLSFHGGSGEVWSSGEYRVHFPDGIQEPFHVVSVEEVVRGKWPERLTPPDEAETPNSSPENATVFDDAEALAVRAYILGDNFDTDAINRVLAKTAAAEERSYVEDEPDD